MAQRKARGQRPLPRVAVVTRSLALDWSGRLFAPLAFESLDDRPLLITSAKAPPDELAAAKQVAEVVMAGEDDVDLAEGLRKLAAAGTKVLLCEGGPTLNGQLLAGGLVDELCLTVSPVLVGGLGRRVSGWNAPRGPLPLQLVTAAEEGGVLLLRYAVAIPGSPGKVL
jgi:riboflavin biosynthesis pyrimidine reductase